MSALLSSPSSNHLPLSNDEAESIHNDETTFVNTVRTSTEVLRASSQTPRGQGLRDSVPLPPQTYFCSPYSSPTIPLIILQPTKNSGNHFRVLKHTKPCYISELLHHLNDDESISAYHIRWKTKLNDTGFFNASRATNNTTTTIIIIIIRRRRRT